MFDDTQLGEAPAPARAASALGNRLLAALTTEALAALAPYRGATMVAPGTVLLEPSDRPAEAFFPVAGTVLTLLALLPGRKPVETAMVGAEGGTGALLGPQASGFGFRLQVLTGGSVIRIPAAAFADALAGSAELRGAVARYAAAHLAQLRLGVACAALHPVEERAARWMLDLAARTGERSLPLTQEALADLLGVRRTTITRVVAALEDRGVVRHRRGRIIVVDRGGLEGAACACHGLARRQFEAVAPGLFPMPDPTP